MGKLTIWIGLLMILLGLAAYVISSFASVTALIPAFFGVPIAILGALARKPSRQKAAGIAVTLLALLGLFGILGRLIPMITNGSFTFDLATIVQLCFALFALDLVVLWLLFLFGKKKATSS